MLADEAHETLRVPELQIPHQSDSPSPTGSTPGQRRRRRFRMRRSKAARSRDNADTLDCSGNLEYLQLPSIEITPSSDEDSARSNTSTPSTSPRRHGLRPRSWGCAKESAEPAGTSGSRSERGASDTFSLGHYSGSSGKCNLVKCKLQV